MIMCIVLVIWIMIVCCLCILIAVVLILSIWDSKTGGSVEPEVINLILLNELSATNNLNNNYTKYILTIN